MNAGHWVRDRTTSELLDLQRLLTCLTKPIDMPSNDRRLRRLAQVNNELHVRQERQLDFMDRLDGGD